MERVFSLIADLNVVVRLFQITLGYPCKILAKDILIIYLQASHKLGRLVGMLRTQLSPLRLLNTICLAYISYLTSSFRLFIRQVVSYIECTFGTLNLYKNLLRVCYRSVNNLDYRLLIRTIPILAIRQRIYRYISRLLYPSLIGCSPKSSTSFASI